MRKHRRADGQAGMTKLIVAFRNFAKATEVVSFIVAWQLNVSRRDRNSQFIHNTVAWLSIGHELRSVV